MDEAHNARTPLTFDTLQRVHPAVIIEFTATPNTSETNGSNILYHVSAAELKAEEMIKLPIILTEHAHWQDAGATVILVNNVHSKIIAIDNLVIIEGSFNWLSAPREGQYVRQECSLRYQGEKAADFIHQILDPIRKKANSSLLCRQNMKTRGQQPKMVIL